MPRVSVLIPTYNRVRYVQEAIESVRGQTYQDWELVVVDDGSTDETPSVLERFTALDRRIRRIRQRNRGGAAALNTGLRAATGELVAFLDSDDRWLPEKLERQVTYLDRHPEHAGVFCLAKIIDAEGRFMGKVNPPPGIDPSLRTLFAWSTMWLPSMTMIRRACLQRVGDFDERIQVGYDRDLWVRMLLEQRLGKLEEPLAEYRDHGDKLSKRSVQLSHDRLTLLGKLHPNTDLGISKSWLKWQIGQFHRRLAGDYLDRRNFGRAAWHLAGAILTRTTGGT